MNYKLREWIVVILLILTVTLSFAFPKITYEGAGFIPKLRIPISLADWAGADISRELNIQPGEGNFDFISDVLAYQYINKHGNKLLFIILDAGNFHHPKVCFTSAGYTIKELEDKEFNVMGRTIKAHALFTEKEGESFLSFYWIVIDKNVAHEWIEQKFKQLYFSLFNKKRVGLMVRIDVPTTEAKVKDAMAIAEDFINTMSMAFPGENVEYIFGGDR
ncbi:MAG: EpsI family protein [Candidatus Omnitrophica bacterium]|nr:EpsI family protein [Candidatus Omnitrophota bacterium]